MDEIDMIKRMPLSRRRAADRLIWHFTKNGEYTVKSGYRVARTSDNLAVDVSTSSTGGHSNVLWKRLWAAGVQPKVKAFIWRCLRGILPTRAALEKKRVQLDEQCCLFCRGDIETPIHVFKDCNVVGCFWLLCPLGLKARSHAAATVRDWVEDMLHRFRRDELDIFFMCLWTIWEERNKILWEGNCFNPHGTVSWSMQLLHEYKACHPNSDNAKKKRAPMSRWETPPVGRIKLNCDAAYDKVLGNGGLGVVARDDKGVFVAACSQLLPFLGSVLHGEAEACKAALMLARDLGWKEIELESDSSIVIAALNKLGTSTVEVSRIVEDCLSFMAGFDCCTIRHVRREANSVADRLAYFASKGRVVDLSLHEAPDFIQDVLYEDLCNVAPIQGRGTMSPLLG